MESKTRSPVGVSGKNSSHLRIVLVGRPPQHPGDQDLALGALAGAVKQPQGILHRIRLLRHQLIHGFPKRQVDMAGRRMAEHGQALVKADLVAFPRASIPAPGIDMLPMHV